MGVVTVALEAATAYARENAMVVTAVVLGALLAYVLFANREPANLPPKVKYWLPFIGSAIELGVEPILFLEQQRAKLGNIFTLYMFGRRVIYMTGAKANEFFFNAREEDFSAQHAYASLTVPVFGEGVVYDVPNPVLVEQKKMIKSGLSNEIFQSYAPLMEEETLNYFKRWSNSGDADLLQSISEVTIMTASRCLMGAEIRSVLDEQVADLYKDLDAGFTPVNFLFPGLPLPVNRRRDRAHRKMRDIFVKVIRGRLENNNLDHTDMLQNLLNASYKSGHKLGENEVAHLLIALLMAGQHTSSTTGTWMGHYIARYPEFQNKIRAEIKRVCGDAPISFEDLRQLEYLDNFIKEVLRLHPPIFQVMRKVMADMTYQGYFLPKGSYVAASPTVSQRQDDVFADSLKFDPDRYKDGRAEDNTPEGRFCYVPFGAGRHRCIGEPFAYLQLKAVWVTLLRNFEFEADGEVPKSDFTSLVVMPAKTGRIRYRRIKPIAA